MTVSGALQSASALLAAAGVESAAWDAELLLRHLMGWDRARVVTSGGEELPSAALAAFDALVASRASRRPLQHLTGVQAFWRHEFVVTPDVLVPRPETEIAVEAALHALGGVASPVIVDVGTGSGCIALSLASERPDAEVHAVDLSPAALAVARENARLLQLSRVVFHVGDLLAPVSHLRPALVISNPPYIEADDVGALAPEVRDHEPRLALVPPEGPLALYARLIGQAADMQAQVVVLEVGAGQAAAVARMCVAAGLGDVRVVQDLAGIPRTVVARRS